MSERMNFCDVFEDVTKEGRKLQTSEYLEEGKYPIFDQGQNEIAGYTNEEDGLFTAVPVVLFGDHTRVVKYVDRPCFLGADGVKLLKPKTLNANVKYLYYAVSSIPIPDTGYNRHFKWLKESTIIIPREEEQKRIVDVLGKINAMISLRKKQLQKLDDLVEARFVEMFGDPVSNQKGWTVLTWSEIFDTKTGKLDSNASVDGGQYPFFTCAKEWLWIDKYAYDCEALLLAGNNAAGIYDVKHYKGKFNVYQRTYILQLLNDNWSYSLFKYQLEDKLQYLQSQSKGTNTRYLTMGILNSLSFIVPPKNLQDEFSTFTTQVDKSKLSIQQGLEKLETLKKSLMQQYFG